MNTDPLELIASINRILTGSGDARQNISLALDETVQSTDAVRAFILLRQKLSETFIVAARSGFDAASFRRLESRVNGGFFDKIFQRSKVTILEDVANEPTLSFLAADHGASLLCSPMMLAGQDLGLLCLQQDGDAIKRSESFIEMAASMIGQTLRIEHSVRGEREKLIEENSHLKQELRDRHEFAQIIGNSSPMKLVYEQVTQVARSNATVLLRGESGTGKEMIANAIHYNSLRGKQPLVKINCAALPETLIESELFGHEKGAFTGAERAKKGRFEMADGGTLFLDEIGDIPPQTQIKLLRVLQEREFERLGGTQTIKTNIRLITATNRNLEQAIADGDFREDLYYRLNVFSIFLPPLRERKSDILLLAEHFVEKYEAEHGKRIRRISTQAIDMLMSYHFPGNVRELENAIERAVLVCDTNVIHGHHLPPTLQTAEVSGTETKVTLASAVEAFERDLIQDTLKSTNGNVSRAARSLDSTERILGYKIKKYNIDPSRFKKRHSV